MSIAGLTFPLIWHLAFLCVVYLVPAHAMTPEQMVEELIGAPVYASDGHEVGEVLDVSMSSDGEVDAVRIKTGTFLGLGERVLVFTKGNFIALRGAVVLDVPAEAVETLSPPQPNGTLPDRD
jgi:sporulation protein YlmC with PRC-barrel domain